MNLEYSYSITKTNKIFHYVQKTSRKLKAIEPQRHFVRWKKNPSVLIKGELINSVHLLFPVAFMADTEQDLRKIACLMSESWWY